MCVLAVRLVQRKTLAQSAPQTPAEHVIPKAWRQLLSALRKAPLLTVRDFYRHLAGWGDLLSEWRYRAHFERCPLCSSRFLHRHSQRSFPEYWIHSWPSLYPLVRSFLDPTIGIRSPNNSKFIEPRGRRCLENT